MQDFKAKMHQIVCRLGLDFRGLLLGEGNGGDPLLSRYTPATIF